MGTVYMGPFADAIGYHDHEGYAARILPDGTETGTWTWETREFVAHVARCDCGWRGQRRYLPTDDGRRLADEEWDHDHLRPMVDAIAERYSVSARELVHLAVSLRKRVRERYTTPDPVDGLPQLTERGGGLADAAELIEEVLEDLAQRNSSDNEGR